jgi:hypothetical protein
MCRQKRACERLAMMDFFEKFGIPALLSLRVFAAIIFFKKNVGNRGWMNLVKTKQNPKLSKSMKTIGYSKYPIVIILT